MAKDTTITLPLFKELLEAHLQPIRHDIHEIKLTIKEINDATFKAQNHAENAHKKIEVAQATGKGISLGYGMGAGITGGGLMMYLAKYWPFGG